VKLPPRLANWLRARGRAHERHAAEHQRLMAQVDIAPLRRRRLRVPPPPGGWQQGGAKKPDPGHPRYHGRPLPPPQDWP